VAHGGGGVPVRVGEQGMSGELHGGDRKLARGPLEARKDGEGGSVMDWCLAAAMAWAAVFQGAGRGVGAWIGV
jgi:hypothetical protein